MAYIRANNVGELLALSGAEFVGACYVTLLGRNPESSGIQHHLAQLNAGVARLAIAEGFVLSEEALAYRPKVSGLGEALIEARIEKHAATFASSGLTHEMSELISFLNLIPPSLDHRLGGLGTVTPSSTIAYQGEGTFVITRLRDSTQGIPSASASTWYDLTDLFQRTKRTHAQLRAQLESARLIQRCVGDLRFLLQVGNDLLEVDAGQIAWLFDEVFIADAFARAYLTRDSGAARMIEAFALEPGPKRHPCEDGDMVISLASLGKKTDRILAGTDTGSQNNIRMCHIISDEKFAAHKSTASESARDKRYLSWLSSRSELLIFANESASAAVSDLQHDKKWSLPQQITLNGLGFIPRLDAEASREIVEALGVGRNFALYFGSLSAGSNLDTLYRAWILAREQDASKVPQLVLCGGSGTSEGDIIEAMRRDPRLAADLVIVRASDHELAALIRQAAFIVNPASGSEAQEISREAAHHGKRCIVAETTKNGRRNDSTATYVHPSDVRAWANAIIAYGTNPEISNGGNTEQNLAQDLFAESVGRLKPAIEQSVPRKAPSETVRDDASPAIKPTIWMDLTLTFMDWSGHITGIIRAELTFAYYLKKLAPDTRYFAHVRGEPGYFFEIEPAYLEWLFDAVDLSSSYRYFNDFWKDRETTGAGYRDPFRLTGGPVPGHRAYLDTFPANSVVFFAAIDQDGTGKLSRCLEVVDIVSDEQASMTSQLIYDLTPFLMPQMHHEYTVRGYAPFVEFVSNHFDHLLFGGRTSQRDCLRIQHDAGWGTPPSDFVEFGSDIALAGESVLPPIERDRSLSNEKAILERLGVRGAFVITVGSLEPRKNHEVLYRAYLDLLDRDTLTEDLQLIFIGKKGWKIDDLLSTIAADERVRGKLLILSPSDEELEALYFQCRFTLLPSFYEGWSLTLPESLSYGKFCLVSDVDPLRETGGDLVEYIHPLDTTAWADKIEHYVNNPSEVEKWEQKIKLNWHPRSWRESAQMLIERLHDAHANRFPY